MIKLVSRKEAVEQKRIICSALSKLQQAFYDEEMLQLYKEDGEEQLYWEQFDLYKESPINYAATHTIIGLSHTDIHSFTPLLAEKLKALLTVLGCHKLILLAHIKRDLFGNTAAEFAPLANAYKQLRKITGQQSYKEALATNLEDLPALIDIFFWISRCDPAAPEYIFFFDADEKVEFTICKYGNIHLTQFGNEVLTSTTLQTHGWRVIEGTEWDNFTEDSIIPGRKIRL